MILNVQVTELRRAIEKDEIVESVCEPQEWRSLQFLIKDPYGY